KCRWRASDIPIANPTLAPEIHRMRAAHKRKKHALLGPLQITKPERGVERTCRLVDWVNDKHRHCNGLRSGHGPLDGVGQHDAAETPTSEAKINCEPAYQDGRDRVPWQTPGHLGGQVRGDHRC